MPTKQLLNKYTGTLLLCSALLLSFAPANADISPNPSSAPMGAVMAAWTQITGNASSGDDVLPLAGVARFVIQGINQDCTQFYIANANANPNAQNQERYSPAPFATRPYPAQSTDTSSEKFPITVCETAFNSYWSRAILRKNEIDINLWSPTGGTGAKVEFPTLYSVGRKNNGIIRMAGFGDTGCRDKGSQPCNSSSTWPLRSLANSAAGNNPDLIIHVGDYRYSNKTHSDRWEYWYEEFFYPAQALLLKAPWAPARGNHEECGYDSTSGKKAPWGTGWFYLMQNKTIANSVSCNSAQNNYLPPWYFDVGVKSGSTSAPTVSSQHRFIMMDTSTSDTSSTQVNNFKTMINLSNANGVSSSWWVGHKPIWGVKSDENGDTTPGAIQKGPQEDLTTAITALNSSSSCWPTDNLPCSLKTVLSGHIHMLQRIKFYTQGSNSSTWIRPQQYVVGNSGVAIDDGFTVRPCSFNLPKSSKPERGTSLKAVNQWQTKFGYVTWDRPTTGHQAGWVSTRHYYSGGDQPDNAPDPSSKTDYPTCVINVSN